MKNTFTTLFFTGLLFTASAQAGPGNRPDLARGIHFAPLQSPLHTAPNRLWLDASVQIAWIDNFYGMAAGGNLHYLNRNRRHFQLRYNFIQKMALFSPVECELSDIGYLMGWLYARKYLLMEVAIGVGCVSGYNLGEEDFGSYWSTTYKRHPFTTVGIPFETDIKFMAGRYAGLGIVIKANLNPESSYVSGGFELTLNGPN